MTTYTHANRAIKPHLNWNGSNPETLEADLHEVCKALKALQDAMGQAFPHGRDYQDVDPAEYSSARRTAMVRLELLRLIEEGLHRDVAHLMDERSRVGR